MRARSRAPLRVAACLALGCVVSGCGGGAGPAGGGAPAGTAAASSDHDAGVAGSITRNGVRVELRWTAGTGTAGTLSATFTPQQQGFHLYSVSLPAAGVQGVGRPLRLAVGGALSAAGDPTADREVVLLRMAGVSVPVPVYPDGPVTLRLAVRRAAAGSSWARVGYAACSAAVCLPPVSGVQVPLTLP